jgi:hypothetical protein
VAAQSSILEARIVHRDETVGVVENEMPEEL